MLLVVGESLRNECLENRQMMYMVDITDETRPWPVANFQVPEESGNFCERGGRFGTHSSNENMTRLLRQIVFLRISMAGFRSGDIRDPWTPQEGGYYIAHHTSQATTQRCKLPGEGGRACKRAIQTNTLLWTIAATFIRHSRQYGTAHRGV